VQQIGEAAVDVERLLHMASTTRDVGLMAGLNDAAQKAAELLGALDATTGAAVALDSDCPALEIGADVATELIDVATVSARITRLQYRVEQVLARFEQRRGPERGESLRWLVWRLCDLYHRETGRRVTNSAVDASRCNYTGTNYTGAHNRRRAASCLPLRRPCIRRKPGQGRPTTGSPSGEPASSTSIACRAQFISRCGSMLRIIAELTLPPPAGDE
jgi:hypothetical protein